MHDQAVNEIFEGCLEMEDIYFTPKETMLDYAQASSDGLTKAVTVVSISAALAAELISQRLKEDKLKKS